MELWKFGGYELRIQLLELFNKIIDKNPNATRMGDRNGDKHTQKRNKKTNVKITEELVYCPQPTNYLQI